MNPNQPQSPVSDAAAMSAAINALPPAPAPQDIMGGAPVPPVAPAPQPAAPAPEGDGFFGNPPAGQPYVPQYPTPPAMPPAAPQQPAPAVPAPAQPGTPAPTAPPVPDPNAIPLGGIPAPAAPAPQPGQEAPAWAQEVIQAAAELKAAQAGQPAPGTVPAGQAPAPAAPGQPAPADDWKPESWADVNARIEERAQQLFQQGWSQMQATQQAQQEAESQALAEADKAIDTALDTLRQTGYLPPMADPSNPDDPGRVAQKELIAYTISQGTDDLTKTAPVLYALHQSGYFFDTAQNKLVRRGSQTAAAAAPVAGATPSVAAATTGQITYADLARRDLHSMADLAAQTYPTDNQNMNL